MSLNIAIGTFAWNWWPHAWLYRPDEASKGALGFAWLFLNVRLDFSRELASRSFTEKGLYGNDGAKRPTLEVDWPTRLSVARAKEDT